MSPNDGFVDHFKISQETTGALLADLDHIQEVGDDVKGLLQTVEEIDFKINIINSEIYKCEVRIKALTAVSTTPVDFEEGPSIYIREMLEVAKAEKLYYELDLANLSIEQEQILETLVKEGVLIDLIPEKDSDE